MKQFTHFKTWLMLCLFLIVGVGSSWAEEVVYKTALFGSSYNSQGISSYSNSWTATNDGFTVNLANWNNNNNGWSYVKSGSKNNAVVGSITTGAAVDKAVTKVVVTIDAITATNVNSITLYSGTSADNCTTSEGTFSKSQGAQTVTISSPSANKFYKVAFDCKKSSNGIVTVSKVEYYYDNSSEGGGGDKDPVAVTDVTLDQTSLSLKVGKTATLTATVNPNDADNKNISWSSNNPDVATVDNGVVTAVAPGNATITVTTEDGTFTATCDVTVIENVVTYANTYTSGDGLLVTTEGTSASEAKVNWDNYSYNAIKAGTSSTAGAIKVTVPANTKTIHFHAAGWNGETTKVTITGLASNKEVSLNADAGVSGSSPFTLQSDPETKHYYSVDTNNDEKLTLTFTATTGKRFVLFGVNAEADATKYNVKFYVGGEEQTSLAQKVVEDGNPTTVTEPTKAGYTFDGWYENSDFSGDKIADVTSVTISADKNFYGRFNINNYTITYNNVEGATNNNPASYTIETATINLAEASKDGYIFQGWFDNESLTGDAVTTIAQGSTGDKTFWAKWVEVPANPSTVTFNVGEHGTCATASSTEETVGAGVSLPEVTANEGWVFKGWSTENPATAETIVSASVDGMYHILANTTLYAYYKVKPATPTFSSEAGNIEKGTEVTISCTTEGAAIYYTTNGDEPTAESAAYSVAIAVNAEQTIKAIAILDGEQSEVASAAYTIAQHTAQFSINGDITAANNCTVAKGEAITFPADPEEDGVVFMGWATATIDGTQDDAPTMFKAATMGNADVTYYAVFAKQNGSGAETWNKVTSADAIVDGGKYILAGTDGTNGYYAAQEFTSGNKNIKTASATVSDDVITITDAEKTAATLTLGKVTIEGNTYYTINDGTNYWYANGSTLTKPANQLMGHSSIDEDGRDYWTISISSTGILSIVNKVDSRGTMQYNYNNGSPIFNAYSSASQKAVELYKYNAGTSYSDYCTTVKTTLTLSFAEATYNATMGEEFDAPTLTNTESVTVTYSSSDTDVATVDSESGEVTLVGAGTTTITATFAGNETYNEASASYELVVLPVITFDENYTEIAEIEGTTYGKVTVNRTLKAGYWNTFCVPFEMSADDIETNFGADAEVMELTGLGVRGTDYNMVFGKAESIEAGVPYMVKVSEAKNQIVVNGAYVNTALNDTQVSDETETKSLTFHGTYCKQNAFYDTFIISSNVFYFVDSEVTLKGFRGYITIDHEKGSDVRALTFSFDEGLSTGIHTNLNADQNGRIYNLQGLQQSKLVKGINIVNGQKVIR